MLIRRTSVAKVVENGKFSLDISSTVDLGTKIGFTTAWAYNRSGDSRKKVSPASSTSNDGAFRARFLSLLIFGEKEKKRKKDCFFFSFYFTTGLHKISHASSWLPRPLFLYLVRRFFGTPQKKKTVWGRRVGLFSSKKIFLKNYIFSGQFFLTHQQHQIYIYIYQKSNAHPYMDLFLPIAFYFVVVGWYISKVMELDDVSKIKSPML